MQQLLSLAFILFSFYALIPTFFMWWISGGFKRGSSLNPHISLTFENGPDPVMTPKFLELLDRQGIKATFFITGEKAERYPQLISKIVQEGHELGYQNYSSRTNWLLTPKRNYRQVQRTITLLKDVSGTLPVYYRPPKGRLNLYNLWQTRSRRGTIALWSVALGRLTATEVRKTVKKVNNGSIITICNKVSPISSEEVQKALHTFAMMLNELSRHGFQFMTLQQLSTETLKDRAIKEQLRSKMNFLLFRVWKNWERLVHHWLRLEYVYTDRNSLFRIRTRRYHGKAILMSDGQWLKRGDKIGELHLNNEMFIQAMQNAKSPVHLAKTIIEIANQSFPVLSQFVNENEKYQDIKAIYGITMIYRGADPFGFQVESLPQTLFTRAMTLYLRMYLSVMHPAGHRRLHQNRSKLVPKLVLMSRDELLRRYNDKSAALDGTNQTMVPIRH